MAMAGARKAHAFDLTGGELCLDFANTVEDRPRRSMEYLQGWADLVDWGLQAGALSRPQASALRRSGERDPGGADRVFQDALALRETIFRLFAALASGRAPGGADLAALNEALAETMGHARVERKNGGFVWAWADGTPTLGRVLWPVVRSAADLLVAPACGDIRQCASETCSWLFLDCSPRKIRRWCSMKTCGNRDKVRRFYARQRASARRRPATSR